MVALTAAAHGVTAVTLQRGLLFAEVMQHEEGNDVFCFLHSPESLTCPKPSTCRPGLLRKIFQLWFGAFSPKTCKAQN